MPIGLRHVISGILAGGILGFRMVLLLLHSPCSMPSDFWVLLFLLPYHVKMIQCHHLLHELAYELAPVIPCLYFLFFVWFFGLFCFGGLFLVGVWFLFV